METVKVRVRVEISSEDVIDTEMTVEQWNALTDDQRYAVYRNAWEAMCESDNGGVSVLTEGAERI